MSDEGHNGWCVLCIKPLGDEDMVPATLPDGCVAHERCWLRAPYEEIQMHRRPAPAQSEGGGQ